MSAENFINSPTIIYEHIARLFTTMFRYSYIPDNFMHVIMVPLVKNKSGDLTNKDNYRPISLSTIISKVFEQIILWKCEDIFLLNEQEN